MIDLHLHSKYSDGRLTVEELSSKVIKAGIKYCSLTDHDNVDGSLEMKKIMDTNSVCFISGVEISVTYLQQEIHVLVYDFDIDKMKLILQRRNKIVSQKREKELTKAVNLFKKQGFIVSDKIGCQNKKPIGLLVALNVYNNKKNKDFLIKKHGYLLNERDFYDSYQAPGKPCFVIKSGIDLDWLLENLKNVKCDKILAHPLVPVSYLVKPLKEKDIDYLMSRGLDGVEVYHSNNSNNQIKFLKDYVERNKLLFTGGSDYHGKTSDEVVGLYNPGKKIPKFKLSNYSA